MTNVSYKDHYGEAYLGIHDSNRPWLVKHDSTSWAARLAPRWSCLSLTISVFGTHQSQSCSSQLWEYTYDSSGVFIHDFHGRIGSCPPNASIIT